jgi:dTDP-glucose 4,6-dehydratase
MRLLITGGAGFIGSNFVRRVANGSLSGVNSVVILDNLTYAGSLENIPNLDTNSFEFVKGDICDRDLVLSLTRNCDVVINFAAESHVDKSIASSGEFIRTNVVGAENLLSCSLKNEVSIFLQVSTDEVYGSIDSGSWTEDFPLLPNSPYSASKASSDLLARAYFKTYGMDVRVTRSSNNYGPFQYPEKAIPLFITNLLQNKKIPLYGNGENVRDWLHVDDHCFGIERVLMSGLPGNVYNIGGGKEMKNIEVAQVILNILDKDDRWIEWVSDRPGHDHRYSLDFKKAQFELGYYPKVDFKLGIAEVIAWYQSNSNWWSGKKERKTWSAQ